MYKVKLFLKSKYTKETYDFISEMPSVPKIDEMISIKDKDNYKHFEIKFIQHFFDNDGKYMYIMITAFLI